MRISKRTRAILGLAIGAATAASVAAASDVHAAKAKAKGRGGVLKVIDCNVEDLDGVFLNDVIELTFTTPIDAASVNPAVFQVRERNPGSGYTIQIPGSFQVAGSVVRFHPRLPTHLRDPNSLTDEFYGFGTPRDDALENAGLKPTSSYELRVIGGGSANAARSAKGRRLVRSYVTHFTTRDISPAADAYTIEKYGDSPPPRFRFSNPSDKVASPADFYAIHGGTRDVPNAVAVSLYGNRVPISTTTLRKTGNVTLTMTERAGDPSQAKPIRGNVFVEQNSESVRTVFKPIFPLPDRGTFALRLTKDVKDLTEGYDFASNAERLRLRTIYEYMETAQEFSPQLPPELLPSPDPVDIPDWPELEVDRGPLKVNILKLGRTYPTEVDPRIMVLFSTRDEPVSEGNVVLEFDRNDGLYDAALSTASYDEEYPGAASAVLTIAAGSAANGDYNPAANDPINIDTYPNRTINWRKVRIPANVTVTITGSRPATIRCFEMELDGVIAFDGRPGAANTSSNYDNKSRQVGGAGGPGGGKGGDSSVTWSQTGDAGSPGVDEAGVQLNAQDGGRGGQPGGYPNHQSNSGYYGGGGGGGGGGGRLAGETGATTTGAGTTPTWAQGAAGGAGGAGSANDDLVPMASGAGGGSGGNGQYYYQPYGWALTGGSGGGGGGSAIIQCSGTITIGTTGVIRARGGQGGKGASYSSYDAGPGGGGGGGSILLRSTKGLNFVNAGAATDVRGGARGATGGGTYSTAQYGGAGGAGYVRTEDPGATASGIPGASSGVYDPVGGGLPSIVYTKWVEVGVDGPRFVEFTQNDFILNAAGNDAVLLEMQMAIENLQSFGNPLLTAVDTATQNSTNVNEVSQWIPVRVVDLTGIAGGAFGAIPGYDQGLHGSDHIFPVSPQANGKNYRFLRMRVRFQLDNTQSIHEPFPYVDRVTVNFQFNI